MLKVTTEEKNVACCDCFDECPWILAVINVLLAHPCSAFWFVFFFFCAETMPDQQLDYL